MSEDNTRKLTADEKLDLLLSDMAEMKQTASRTELRLTSLETKVDGLDTRLASLETKVDERLHDTRPMWQAIHAQTEKLVEQQAQTEQWQARMEERLDQVEQRTEERHAETQKALQQIYHQLEEVAVDQLRVKGSQRELKQRVAALEEPQQKVA